MAKRMGDGGFRAAQMEDRDAPHVEPINRLVDDAFGRPDLGWTPYVAALHGGIGNPVGCAAGLRSKGA